MLKKYYEILQVTALQTQHIKPNTATAQAGNVASSRHNQYIRHNQVIRTEMVVGVYSNPAPLVLHLFQKHNSILN
jgi:hypothetical protein